jgi:hypothetical protein
LRRIPLSRRSHVIGFQPLATGIAEHESALERDFVTLTSFLDAAVCITSQPVTLKFGGGADGLSRRYTPDFLVNWSGRPAELIEVKYRADLGANWKRLRPGFIAARAWAKARGATFRIATERSIRCGILENAKRLLPLRNAPVDAEIAAQVLLAARSLDVPTFGAVLTAVRDNRPAVLATLWRLIARGTLHVELSVPITLATRVSLL